MSMIDTFRQLFGIKKKEKDFEKPIFISDSHLYGVPPPSAPIQQRSPTAPAPTFIKSTGVHSVGKTLQYHPATSVSQTVITDDDTPLLNTILAAEVISEVLQPQSQAQPVFQGFDGGDSGGGGASGDWQPDNTTATAAATQMVQDDPQPQADPVEQNNTPDPVDNSSDTTCESATDTSSYDNS